MSAESKAPNTIEELAEDMVLVLERLRAIEAAVQTSAESQGRTLASMRGQLQDDRKALAAIGAFNVLVVLLDQLRAMHAGLDEQLDERMLGQLRSLIAALQTTIRGLGFTELIPSPGAAFDAESMVHAEQPSDRPSIVVSTKTAGYRVGTMVVRPAAVIVRELDRGGAGST